MHAVESVTHSKPRYWRLLCWFAVTVAFTASCIQFSCAHGRLIAAPGYDDVSYFCDGAERIEVFYFQGWPGLIRSYIDDPPHLPFFTTLATL